MTPQLFSHNTAADLFEDILSNGFQIQIRVTGRSMSPFLKDNETVIVVKEPICDLKKGDLILFNHPKGVVILHRIISIRTSNNLKQFYTKGDSVLCKDDPVSESHILGKVVEIKKLSPLFGCDHINMNDRFWRTVNYLIAGIGEFRTSSFYQRLFRAAARFLNPFMRMTHLIREL